MAKNLVRLRTSMKMDPEIYSNKLFIWIIMDPPIILIHIPKNVQQKTANMSDMSQELERELEKAAEESARGIVKRCLDAASTDSDKVG